MINTLKASKNLVKKLNMHFIDYWLEIAKAPISTQGLYVPTAAAEEQNICWAERRVKKLQSLRCNSI